MNDVTRQELKEFIQEVLNFAFAVSSVAGTNALDALIGKGEQLMEQLDKDPTIL
jgi:hypothetical protein